MSSIIKLKSVQLSAALWGRPIVFYILKPAVCTAHEEYGKVERVAPIEKDGQISCVFNQLMESPASVDIFL